jgi:hypothetical protein
MTMKNMILVGTMVACVLIPLKAQAQRAGGWLKGYGTASCGVYLDQIKISGFTKTYAQWALGYIGGYNMFSVHPAVPVPDAETIIAYQEKFCKESPLKPTYFGVIALIGELGGWQSN